MNICIESRLRSIGEELRNKGFNICFVEDCLKADVFLYEEHQHIDQSFQVELSSEISTKETNTFRSSVFNELIPADNGTLLVNVWSMSVDEISAVLRRRSYTPILKDTPTQ